MRRPYVRHSAMRRSDGYHNDSMHMIGHDHERIQFHGAKMARYFLPTRKRNLAKWIQFHLAFHNLAE